MSVLEVGHSAYFVKSKVGILRIWHDAVNGWTFRHRTEYGDWEAVEPNGWQVRQDGREKKLDKTTLKA